MKSGWVKTRPARPLAKCFTILKLGEALETLSERWTMVYQKDNPPKGALHSINVPTINVPNVRDI